MDELTKEDIALLRELHGRFKVFTMMHEDWNDAVGALPALLDAVEQRDKMRELLEKLNPYGDDGKCVYCGLYIAVAHELGCDWVEAMK